MNLHGGSKVYLFASVVALTVVLCSIAAWAQLTSGELEAKVPFPFTATNTSLPAGSYFIQAVEDTVPVLELTNFDARVGVMLQTENAQAKPNQTSELVFDKFGDKYFLREVWVEGSSYGYFLPKPRAEVKLEKSGAKLERHRLSIIHHKNRKH